MRAKSDHFFTQHLCALGCFSSLNQNPNVNNMLGALATRESSDLEEGEQLLESSRPRKKNGHLKNVLLVVSIIFNVLVLLTHLISSQSCETSTPPRSFSYEEGFFTDFGAYTEQTSSSLWQC